MDEDGDHLLKLTNKIAVEQNFKTFKVQITPINSGGANYTSKLYQVKISGEGRDDLKLFAKLAIINEKMRDEMPLKPYYSEWLVYTELMKVYTHLEDKHGVAEEHRLQFPKYYGADKTHLQEILVLEDLNSRGCESADRFKSVDWQYASAAVTELAKFHALSIAYQHEYPSDFDRTLSKFPSGMFSDNEDTRAFYTRSVKTALSAVREENKEKLKAFLDGYDICTYCDMFNALRRQVLIHVDFRPNNLLHRVRDNGTTEVIPVDYQTVQGGCPVIDLLYFIFTATDGQFRAQHYRQLLDHYHSELGAALARLGLDVEKEYSKNDFEFDLKEKLPYGLLVSVIWLPMLTVSEDRAPPLGTELNMASLAVQATGAEYPGRLNDVVDNYVAWKIL